MSRTERALGNPVGTDEPAPHRGPYAVLDIRDDVDLPNTFGIALTATRSIGSVVGPSPARKPQKAVTNPGSNP